MSVAATPTPDNLRLAGAITKRMGADAALVGARSALWKYTGIGAVLTALGVATGFGFYGYSHVAKMQITKDVLATALTEALEKTTVKVDASGDVTVKGGTVALKNGQTVALDPGGTVSLEPGASVTVKGQITVDPIVPPAPVQAASPKAAPKVVTNFTVFKAVEFGSGIVETGWQFASSNQSVPTRQYCTYREVLQEGTIARVTIGEDGHLKQQSRQRSGFDVVAAFNNCVWFRGTL